MQPRFTAHGLNSDNKEVVLAFELNEEAVQISLHIVLKKSLTTEQIQYLEKNWVEGDEFIFPDDTVVSNPDLNEESILPGDIKSEETGKIRIKQNEWAYRLLTNKLWEVYLNELAALKKRAAELSAYNRKLFEEAKDYWERVLKHRKENDIPQNKLDEIKDDVNGIFDILKELRKKESAEFEENSTTFKNEILEKIEGIKNKIGEEVVFKDLFEALKQVQAERSSSDKRLSRSDDVLVRKAFDAAFQFLHEARNKYRTNKVDSRIENLSKIVVSMEKSLKHDKSDFDYYTKKINHPKANALEIQLAKLKLNMLEEKIASKEAKIEDINKTIEKLQTPKRKQAAVVEPDKAKDNVETTTTDAAENIAETTSLQEKNTSEIGEAKNSENTENK